MSGTGPSREQPEQPPAEPGEGGRGTGTGTDTAPPSPAAVRAGRMTAVNMLRSLLPLLVIILLIAGWNAFRQRGDVDPVRTVDPSSTVRQAAAQASYTVVVPTGLASGYRPTSARTDAGSVRHGDPVTLQIGYLTPSQQYAGFAESDDPRADAVTSVLDGAQESGTVDLGGAAWTRSTTTRGETALSLKSGSVTVVVTGSASDAELRTVAGAVRPYSG